MLALFLKKIVCLKIVRGNTHTQKKILFHTSLWSVESFLYRMCLNLECISLAYLWFCWHIKIIPSFSKSAVACWDPPHHVTCSDLDVPQQ